MSNAFTGFTTNGEQSASINYTAWDSGFDLKTGISDNIVYFPANSYRKEGDGSIDIKFKYKSGFYWSAIPYNTNGIGSSLEFSSYAMRPKWATRIEFGLSIRPVSD